MRTKKDLYKARVQAIISTNAKKYHTLTEILKFYNNTNYRSHRRAIGQLLKEGILIKQPQKRAYKLNTKHSTYRQFQPLNRIALRLLKERKLEFLRAGKKKKHEILNEEISGFTHEDVIALGASEDIKTLIKECLLNWSLVAGDKTILEFLDSFITDKEARILPRLNRWYSPTNNLMLQGVISSKHRPVEFIGSLLILRLGGIDEQVFDEEIFEYLRFIKSKKKCRI